MTANSPAELADLRRHAIPLTENDAARPDGELIPLLASLADARLIGLGEATHGDHESFAFKCKMIRALIQQHGFNLVIFERGVSEVVAYDRYVTGAIPTVPIDMRLYPWLTEEVRDLVLWLRRWNERGGAVRLAGMDLYNRAALGPASALLGELGLVPPPLWQALQAELQQVSDPNAWCPDALARWDATPPLALAPHTSTHRWVLLLAASFRQWLAYTVLQQDPNVKPWEWRDRMMAENALAQLVRFGAETKALIWAHNGHVYHEPPTATGYHLRARLGSAYRSLCCVFGYGSFNAGSGHINPETRVPEGPIDWNLRPQDAEPPPEGALEWLLDQVGPDCFALDPAGVACMQRDRQLRNVGVALFHGFGQFSHHCVPASVFDILVYFRTVRPSLLLPPGEARSLP